MAFKVGFTKESLVGPPPVPDNIYTLKLIKFKPKASSKKTSYNLNPEFEIIDPGFDYNGNPRKVFESLNSNFGQSTLDYVHATGLELESVGTDEEGAELFGLPGVFVGQAENPDDPEKWEYKGPLIGRPFKAELCTTEYQGRKSNKIRSFVCAVDQCATKNPEIKHSQNLIKE